MADHPPRMPHHVVDRQPGRRSNDRGVEFDLTTAVLRHEPIAGRVGVLTGRAGFRSYFDLKNP
jgi:hypothetical protein